MTILPSRGQRRNHAGTQGCLSPVHDKGQYAHLMQCLCNVTSLSISPVLVCAFVNICIWLHMHVDAPLWFSKWWKKASLHCIVVQVIHGVSSPLNPIWSAEVTQFTHSCYEGGRYAGHVYKRGCRSNKKASPVTQKCPVQVGPVLTSCHWDAHARGEGVVAMWCVFGRVIFLLFLLVRQPS